MSDEQPIESWKDIPGFPGYQASTEGHIRSRRRGGRGANLVDEWHILSPRTLPSGYIYASLSAEKKSVRRYVHRVVLETFVGPCPPGQQARHINDNCRSNNRLGNLAWGTPQENSDDRNRHGTCPCGSEASSAKLTEEEARAILEAAARGETNLSLARRFGLRKENISKIVNGHNWGHIRGPRKIHESTLIGHVSSKQAAYALGVSRARIQQLIKAGELMAVRCRKGLWIPEESLLAAVVRRTAKKHG